MDTETRPGSRLFSGKTIHLFVGSTKMVFAGVPIPGAQVRLICHTMEG